jgi:hypothetical protein
MKKVVLKGFGQLNGPVSIDKTLELEDKVAMSLQGSKKDEAKRALLAVYYPGVEINPRNISVSISSIKKYEEHNDFGKFVKDNKPKSNSSFSIGNVILWIIFLPFKLVWWILKGLWKDEKHY